MGQSSALTPEVSKWISRVDWSIHHPTSKIDARVMAMSGFGTPNVLHLLNNLCSWGPTRYLEFGTWAGRSLAAAAWKNEGCYIGVENFHVDAKVNRELAENIRDIPNARVLAMDFRMFQLVEGLWWDVFFYDADHSREATSVGIQTIARSMRCGVIIVDDIELSGYENQVMPGLLDGLRDGDFRLHHSWTLRKHDGYHEGLWLGVVEGLKAIEVEAAQLAEAKRAIEHERQLFESFTKAWTT